MINFLKKLTLCAVIVSPFSVFSETHNLCDKLKPLDTNGQLILQDKAKEIFNRVFTSRETPEKVPFYLSQKNQTPSILYDDVGELFDNDSSNLLGFIGAHHCNNDGTVSAIHIFYLKEGDEGIEISPKYFEFYDFEKTDSKISALYLSTVRSR